MNPYLIAYIVFAVISAVLSYGHSLAYWWREYELLQSEERWKEIRFRGAFAVFITLACPFVTLVTFLPMLGIKHGLLYRYPGVK